jgi:ATP-dependent Clp protease ATP-binding subunit ClpA
MINKISAEEFDREMGRRVIGQGHAAECLFPAIRAARTGLNPEGRPMGVYALTGPTGTGKTHFVEMLAEVLHGSKEHVLRIDCAELALDHDVARLIGAPPGYLGHRETQPMLTQAKLNGIQSENFPASIILFDEIEKASERLHQMLLGVLDKARLKTGDGNTVNFDKSFIFMTSNCGARELQTQFDSWGYVQRQIEQTAVSNVVQTSWRKKFSPEFINRIDEVIVFNSLTEGDYRKILQKLISDFHAYVAYRMTATSRKYFGFTVSPDLFEKILAEGVSQRYGARELKRAVKRYVMDRVIEGVDEGEFKSKMGYILTLDGQLVENTAKGSVGA